MGQCLLAAGIIGKPCFKQYHVGWNAFGDKLCCLLTLLLIFAVPCPKGISDAIFIELRMISACPSDALLFTAEVT